MKFLQQIQKNVFGGVRVLTSTELEPGRAPGDVTITDPAIVAHYEAGEALVMAHLGLDARDPAYRPVVEEPVAEDPPEAPAQGGEEVEA